jgi:hypothetical protein
LVDLVVLNEQNRIPREVREDFLRTYIRALVFYRDNLEREQNCEAVSTFWTWYNFDFTIL